MKRILSLTDLIVNSPYTNMFLGLLFLYTSITSVVEDYQSDIRGLTIHHGLALYGLVMFLQSLINALQAINQVKKVKDEVKKGLVG